MLIQAKYPSTCASCLKAIMVGDRISYVRGQKALHAICSDEGRAVAAKIAPSKAASLADASVVLPVPEGKDYLPYQRAGIAYALTPGRTGTFIADEMGLGKTIQAIGIVNASLEVKRVLVICPASLKLNWRQEILAWSSRDVSVQVLPKTGVATKHEGSTPDDNAVRYEIVNYDILSKILSTAATWDLLVLDEAHYVKNDRSARSKAVKALRKRAARVLALTGTPVLNKPIEIFPILQLVAPEEWDPAGQVRNKTTKAFEDVGAGEGAGWFRFAKRYCNAHKVHVAKNKDVWKFDGSSNLQELQERLRATCMVRRLKAEVLKDLPAKVRQVIPVGNGCHDEKDFGDLGDDYESAIKKTSSIAFEDLSRARHSHALSKVDACIEHLTSCLSDGRKVVVFAHHKDVVDALLAGLAGYSPVRVTGEDSVEERQAAVLRFQGDESCKVFVGNLKAAGVGLTLTASSHVVFVEIDWTPATLTQAEDRCHRIGQKNTVLVQHLVLEGSIDAKMAKFVTEKQLVADLALDTDTMQDVSGRAKVPESNTDPTVNPAPLPILSADEIARVHADLIFLSERCDGAIKEDGMGFNGLDSNFGKTLAALPRLSVRQAAAAKKMLVKYRKQLERGRGLVVNGVRS